MHNQSTSATSSSSSTTSSKDVNVINVDGSVLEGGGQTYSILFNTPITVTKIRQNRSPPGLRPQHLTGLQLISSMSKGGIASLSSLSSSTKPASVNDTDIKFNPNGKGLSLDASSSACGSLNDYDFIADTGTAGSIGLLIQVSLPVVLFGSFVQSSMSMRPIRILMRGGTNAEKAPPIDYMEEILLPFLKQFVFNEGDGSGPQVVLEVNRRGYYPKGGGEVVMSVVPVPSGGFLKSFVVEERGDPVVLRGRIFVAGTLPIHVGEKLHREIITQLCKRFPEFVIQNGVGIEIVKDDSRISVGTAMGCLIYIETTTGLRIAGSSLGGPKSFTKDLSKQCTTMLINDWDHGGCVDEYLQDQLIIFMALAKGNSSIVTGPLSLHTRTAIYGAELLTEARFTCTEFDDGSGRVRIECQGCGLVA
ncbi:hypothetical protein HDU76_005986 [Blyttiomyces sp. JEL0837]|nr:hypothetical protein HDU76_005986 [Blyttiomyces sp. JEL0837]